MKSYDERARDILAKRDEKEKKIKTSKRKVLKLSIIAAALVLAITVPFIILAANHAFDHDDLDQGGVETTAAPETEAAEAVKKEYKDGVIGERPASASEVDEGFYEKAVRDGASGMYKSGMDAISADPSPSLAEADGSPDLRTDPEWLNGTDAVAGTLTAGEWKDLDNLADWSEYVKKYDELVKTRKLNAKNVITVKVKDGELSCFNVAVKLLSGEDVIYAARTDVNGCAYLFFDVDKDGQKPDSVSVGGEIISLEDKTEIEVQAADAGVKVTALDLMLMIDTTGSMGDELEYIKAELYDVVRRVSEAGEGVSIRVSVNFYRDEGDEYVVKYFDFRSDINECIEQLKEQHAEGGGDYPEAVHTALENAVKGHEWRDEAVKLCFTVLDAPPHSGEEIQGVNEELLKTVKAAAEQGIRIIPVASSGVDEETEFLLRNYAALTSGTYIFITDDSGVGGSHKTAEVGEHTTEFLNDCMVRVVCEYCGIYAGEKVPYTPPYHQ